MVPVVVLAVAAIQLDRNRAAFASKSAIALADPKPIGPFFAFPMVLAIVRATGQKTILAVPTFGTGAGSILANAMFSTATKASPFGAIHAGPSFVA